jgi:hypothetical protein
VCSTTMDGDGGRMISHPAVVIDSDYETRTSHARTMTCHCHSRRHCHCRHDGCCFVRWLGELNAWEEGVEYIEREAEVVVPRCLLSRTYKGMRILV